MSFVLHFPLPFIQLTPLPLLPFAFTSLPDILAERLNINGYDHVIRMDFILACILCVDVYRLGLRFVSGQARDGAFAGSGNDRSRIGVVDTDGVG